MSRTCRWRPVGSASRRFSTESQDFRYTLSTLGRLVEADQFADIILNTGNDGEVTYLRDVSRIELGARNQDTLCRLDGRPSPGVVVFLLPGAPARDTPDGIKARPRRSWKPVSPRGCSFSIAFEHHAVHPRIHR